MDGISIYLIVAAVAVGIALILLLREVFCWYAKTNKILRLLEALTDAFLAKTPAAEKPDPSPPPAALP